MEKKTSFPCAVYPHLGTHTQSKWRAECSDDDAKQSDDSLTNKKKERRKSSLHRQSRKTHECSCKKLEEHIDNLTWYELYKIMSKYCPSSVIVVFLCL